MVYESEDKDMELFDNNEVFAEGFAAYNTMNENPYECGSYEHVLWNEGYEHAEANAFFVDA